MIGMENGQKRTLDENALRFLHSGTLRAGSPASLQHMLDVHDNALRAPISDPDTQMQDALSLNPPSHSAQSQPPSASAPLSNLSLEDISLRVEEALRPAQTQSDTNIDIPGPRPRLDGFGVALEPPRQSAAEAKDHLISISETPSSRGGGRRSRGLRRKVSPSVSDTIVVNDGSFTPLEASSAPERRKPGTRGRPRGSRSGRPSLRGSKRKRTQSGGGGDFAGDTDSSENFSPLPSQSRSGRKIFQAPATVSPTIKAEAGTAMDPTFSVFKGPGKKRGGARWTPAGSTGAVCLSCGRGHSPLTNAIVFCDGCNRPWHQYCHVPPIKAFVTEIAEMEWLCTNCSVLKEEWARLQDRVTAGSMSLFEVSDTTRQVLQLRVAVLTFRNQKREYLQTLSQNELVSLLLHACHMHPDLPILAQKPNSSLSHTKAEEDNIFSYPKAGNGIPMPSEQDYLSILIDDDTTTFSHWCSDLSGSIGTGPLSVVNGEVSVMA